jgi:hypothetical protein
MYFFLPNYQCVSVAVRKKMCMAVRKKIHMTARKNMRITARNNMHMTTRKMCVADSKTIGMSMRTKRIKCTMIVDHLCWTH